MQSPMHHKGNPKQLTKTSHMHQKGGASARPVVSRNDWLVAEDDLLSQSFRDFSVWPRTISEPVTLGLLRVQLLQGNSRRVPEDMPTHIPRQRRNQVFPLHGCQIVILDCRMSKCGFATDWGRGPLVFIRVLETPAKWDMLGTRNCIVQGHQSLEKEQLQLASKLRQLETIRRALETDARMQAPGPKAWQTFPG